ncbi:hypothetical protein ACQEU3_27380 [Spirillospora sp. CA-253888]
MTAPQEPRPRYRLHGSPALAFNGERVIAAQALVLSEEAAGA